jgi:hypothetical protein
MVKIWNNPGSLQQIDEWIKKMWYTYTMEYYSAIRNNDMWFEGKYTQLEDIMFSQVSQAYKHKTAYFLPYVKDRSKIQKYTQK